jgi:hypothetical protein
MEPTPTLRSNNLKNEIPFKELVDLENCAKDGRYFKPKISINDPNLVVKEANTKWREDLPSGSYKLNDIESAKKDLAELQKNFSEFLPQTQLVLGKNEADEIVVYEIQERIDGQNMLELPYFEAVGEQLKLFFGKVADVFMENLHYEGKPPKLASIFPDIKATNFIFGTNRKRPSEPPKLYFIDTYPLLRMSVERFQEFWLSTMAKVAPSQWSSICGEFALDLGNRIEEYKIEEVKKQTQN